MISTPNSGVSSAYSGAVQVCFMLHVSILLAHVPEIFLQLHHKYNNTSQLARNLLTVCYCVMPYTQTGRLEIHTTNIMLPDHHNQLWLVCITDVYKSRVQCKCVCVCVCARACVLHKYNYEVVKIRDQTLCWIRQPWHEPVRSNHLLTTASWLNLLYKVPPTKSHSQLGLWLDLPVLQLITAS